MVRYPFALLLPVELGIFLMLGFPVLDIFLVLGFTMLGNRGSFLSGRRIRIGQPLPEFLIFVFLGSAEVFVFFMLSGIVIVSLRSLLLAKILVLLALRLPVARIIGLAAVLGVGRYDYPPTYK